MMVYACECWCLWRPDEGVGFPRARVQVTELPVVRCRCWGSELGSSTRAVCMLNYGTLSPALQNGFKLLCGEESLLTHLL